MTATIPQAKPALYELRWFRVKLTLQADQNPYAKSHPLTVFQAIFNFAAGEAGWRTPGNLPRRYFFHPVGYATGGRVRKGRSYPLELIFVGMNREQVDQFLVGLRRWFYGEARRGFGLASLGEPEERSLAALEREAPLADAHPDELCLEFHTPIDFRPLDKKRRWLWREDQFHSALSSRLAKLFGVADEYLHPPVTGLHLLPYFWTPFHLVHQSKSGSGKDVVSGMLGPLYLRGVWEPLRPWLLLASELHLGNELTYGGGYFSLRTERPHFDRLLQQSQHYREAFEEIEDRSDMPFGFVETLGDREAAVAGLIERLPDYRPPACNTTVIRKPGMDEGRVIGLFDAEATLIQKILQKLLTPVLDRMFEESSVGYRPGRSTEMARRWVRERYQEGYIFALEADIEDFFDDVGWTQLDQQLDRVIPRSDRQMRELLRRFIRCPVILQGQVRDRVRGLIQGSPLSPLLSNLYLDGFDERLARAGFQMIRYADDFVVMTRSREECEKALETVRTELAKLDLDLKPEKTAITPFAAGFNFLGLSFGEQLDDQLLEESTFRKTVFVRTPYTFVGVDDEAIVVKRDDEIVADIPMRRVGQVILFGPNALSTRLIQQLTKRRITATFCTPAGYYINIIKANPRAHFELAFEQGLRHAELGESGRGDVAARTISAKLTHYETFIRSQPGPTATLCRRILEESFDALEDCQDVARLRGIEGRAARFAFRFFNQRARHPDFLSRGRLPGKQYDRYNSLLDFSYSLLFARLNALVRTAGLNPYLGFLHSHESSFESLVCDLQEPFRCRMDRFVLRLINRQIIEPHDFELQRGDRWRLTEKPVGIFLEQFEREMETRYASEPGNMRQLLVAQVHSVKVWAQRQLPRPKLYSDPEALKRRPLSGGRGRKPRE